MRRKTAWLDEQLRSITDDSPYLTVTTDRILDLMKRCEPDPAHAIQQWSMDAFRSALAVRKRISGDKAYLVVRRGRNLRTPRHETQGILAGGEDILAPRDAPTLFLFRQDSTPDGQAEVWWPQLRFADGNYVLAFSFDW